MAPLALGLGEAAYGSGGFWTREQPGGHFATGVGAGPLVARAVAGLLPADAAVVVDVGAGDGRLAAALLAVCPGVEVVAVDRRARPPGLDGRVRWVVDHWDTGTSAWTDGGPDGWLGADRAPLLVAHEWLDDLPVPVVERGPDGWVEVEVDADGRERLGAPVAPADAAWLARWWPSGHRAEVGHPRDTAWAALVAAAHARDGRALLVDYGHVAGERPSDGTLAAYGGGRRRRPVPDGSANLTAHVAVDALATAGGATGATTLLVERQATVLGRVASAADADPLAALVARGERVALTSSDRWGDLWWLLQGAAPSPS